MKQKFMNSKMNLLMVNSIKFLRTLPIVLVLLVISISDVRAQDPVIIQDWSNLEEAEFMFDVYYRIIKCDADSSPQMHLLAFNEGGNVDSVGFTLELSDGDGSAHTQEIAKFNIGKFKTLEASCTNDDNTFLKFDLPTELDLESLKINITYNR